jgi:hypothetical protein
MTAQDDRIEVEVASSIPQATLFHRAQPAYLEGPLENWALAQTAIDFGVALLTEWRGARASNPLKDAVLQALLRRCLVTTEGYVALLSRGLVEPAMSLSRTLLDNDLAIRLIVRDASGKMAKRLAAYHYLTYQQHGQDMLHDRETREGILTNGGRIQDVASIAGSYKRFLEMPVFDDVRDEVRKSRFWHGFSGAEEAFRAAEAPADYFMLYDGATWFVHDVNVDFDYADRTEAEMRLKPLVERDPAAIQIQLGHQLLRFVTTLRLLVEDRGYPDGPAFQVMSTATFPDGRVEEFNALEALTGQLVSRFHLPDAA